MFLNNKNEKGYFILAVFTVFGILAVISTPAIILATGLSLGEYCENNILGTIIFFVIIFYSIPAILTIIQFFRNKELFAIQLFFIFISITALVAIALNLFG